MTNEQAIKVLLDEWKCIDRNDGINCDRQCEKCDLVMDSAILKDAYNMAIQALSQEPTEKPMTVDEMEREYEKSKALFHKIVECDDAISRDMALEKMADYVASGYADSAEDFEEYSRIICQLPSVTQKKSGKWIIHPKGIYAHLVCDKCLSSAPYDCRTNYCPNCGARMVEPQERSDKE